MFSLGEVWLRAVQYVIGVRQVMSRGRVGSMKIQYWWMMLIVKTNEIAFEFKKPWFMSINEIVFTGRLG
jgi:hypothetical protein